MRLAVILAILAREIDRHIFQATYIIAEGTQIREALTSLAASDSEKESFCRSILLSMDRELRTRLFTQRIQIVIRNVSSYLYELLLESHFSNLRQSLEKVVQKAAEFWQPIQRAKRRYELNFEPLKWEDHEWSPLIFPDTDPVVNQISQKDSIAPAQKPANSMKISSVSPYMNIARTHYLPTQLLHPAGASFKFVPSNT
jgi:hypothetical protein